MTAREIVVGDVPALALRVTYVGELGWELYPNVEYASALWSTLLRAGEPHGLIPGGYRAIDSLRLEKGYRAWSADITPEEHPFEAGLGFDAAVSHFVRRDTSPLAGELRTMLAEIRMGESRTNALKGLADRVPADEVRNFVQTLVQSEGVGISRVSILRNQATDLRHRRQLAAEERAQKAPVKMLFPIVIFILPVLFVVILGPAFQYASTVFGPG